MYYPEELIEEIRVHNDIVEVISSYVNLKPKGSSYFGLCPFHNEKTPSFSVTPDKQMYYCFGCGAGGNVYTFIMEYENFTFLEAVKQLADRANIRLPSPEISEEAKEKLNKKQRLYDINKEAARYFYYQLKTQRGQKALEYFKKRQITIDVIKKFGLGYANYYGDDLYKYLKAKQYSEALLLEAGIIVKDKKNNYTDRFWNRVMFPIFDVHNRVIAFGGRVLGDGNPKYLNSPETTLFDKSNNLYALNIARTARKDHILIVEGYMDVISLHQAGYNQTVASLGTAFTSGQARLLKRYTDNVLIAYDNDEAGRKATLRSIPILKEAGLTVKVLNLNPYKDPDDFINNLGPKTFDQRIENAQNSFFFELEVLNQDYNVEDPDQKTQFIRKIASKIVEMTNDIEKDNYIEAVTKNYQINKEHFINLVNELGSKVGLVEKRPTVNKINKKEQKEDGIGQAQKLLLKYLIKDEALYDKISRYIQPSDFKSEAYYKIAKAIYEALEHKQTLNAASIINQFETLEDQKLVAGLFNGEVSDLNIKDKEKLINETVYKLKRFSLDYASRNAKDVEQLQNIIAQQRQLQKMHISLNER
ncbi:DNA primase [Natranaerovirga hydrolytica]|uniref:DNA primase n=1 Tax=Natranaerovirga hydrolytica TaxID=680378 RepID=A0A4R1N1C3_9FIRM|nr:DNA primase [Natranaerovirga hydrolytica]TCK98712.1 DNA primase [Natranaerovirga hydrolytica]